MSIITRDLRMEIPGRTIFSDVNVSVSSGQITALVGPSGSGKTTLLNILGLLLRPTAGLVEIDGEDATGWKENKIQRFWREKAAFIYQDAGIIPGRTVAYNVNLRVPNIFGRFPNPDHDTLRALEAVGMQSRMQEDVTVLSGGEKQRVGIARALYRQARYIYADEPTASLDAANRAQVISLLEEAARAGSAVIVATHDEPLMEHCQLLVHVG